VLQSYLVFISPLSHIALKLISNLFVLCQTAIKASLSIINPDWQTLGITKDIYLSLGDQYNIKSETEIVIEAYKEFDKLNRGFITSTAFQNVVCDSSPRLGAAHGECIFTAADMYQMEKVSNEQLFNLI
jgi:hypothetical protein